MPCWGISLSVLVVVYIQTITHSDEDIQHLYVYIQRLAEEMVFLSAASVFFSPPNGYESLSDCVICLAGALK